MASYVGKVAIGNNTYPIGSTLYGTCSGTVSGDNTSYSVSLGNFDKLETGITIHVLFTVASGTATKLKVGSADAKEIKNQSGAIKWAANSVISFTYDGTYWRMNDGQDTTYSPITEENIKNTSSTSSGLITGQRFNQALTSRIDTSISSASTDTQAASAKAVYTAIQNSFAANDAMVFKGTLGTGGTITAVPTNGYSAGTTYKVITAGTYAGIKCEVGDMLIAINDGPTSGTSVKAADWTVIQTNVDGAVTGPASATNGNIALFDGTTGKIIKNSTYSPSSFAAAEHTQTVNKGGTNITTYTAGDLLYASAATTLSKLNIGAANKILASSGSAPVWKTAGISSGNTGDVTVVTSRGAWSSGTAPSITNNTNDTKIASVTNGTLTINYFNAGALPTLENQSTTKISVSLT